MLQVPRPKVKHTRCTAEAADVCIPSSDSTGADMYVLRWDDYQKENIRVLPDQRLDNIESLNSNRSSCPCSMSLRWVHDIAKATTLK